MQLLVPPIVIVSPTLNTKAIVSTTLCHCKSQYLPLLVTLFAMFVPLFATVGPPYCHFQSHSLAMLVPPYANVSLTLWQCKYHSMPMLGSTYANVSPTLRISPTILPRLVPLYKTVCPTL